MARAYDRELARTRELIGAGTGWTVPYFSKDSVSNLNQNDSDLRAMSVFTRA